MQRAPLQAKSQAMEEHQGASSKIGNMLVRCPVPEVRSVQFRNLARRKFLMHLPLMSPMLPASMPYLPCYFQDSTQFSGKVHCIATLPLISFAGLLKSCLCICWYTPCVNNCHTHLLQCQPFETAKHKYCRRGSPNDGPNSVPLPQKVIFLRILIVTSLQCASLFNWNRKRVFT